ncbi:hypothetical protein HDV03_000107 [Kappamyces sp. JEL0829]|nr:hypothetical protein HDV03_000107 [Kappamyces sp. JEL0829]
MNEDDLAMAQSIQAQMQLQMLAQSSQIPGMAPFLANGLAQPIAGFPLGLGAASHVMDENEIFLTLAMEEMYKEQFAARVREGTERGETIVEKQGEKEQALFELYLAHFQREAQEKAALGEMAEWQQLATNQLLAEVSTTPTSTVPPTPYPQLSAATPGAVPPIVPSLLEPGTLDLATLLFQQQAAMEMAAGMTPDMKGALASLNFTLLANLLKKPGFLPFGLGKNPLTCKICGKEFKSSKTLNLHARQHSQVKPYPCLFDGCSSSFAQKSHLDAHILTHTGERPYKCPHCSNTYTTPQRRNEHMLSHTNFEGSHECPTCQKKFRNLHNLKAHQKTHIPMSEREAESWSCSICKAVYAQRTSLIRHRNQAHKDEKDQFKAIRSYEFKQFKRKEDKDGVGKKKKAASGSATAAAKPKKKSKGKSDGEDDGKSETSVKGSRRSRRGLRDDASGNRRGGELDDQADAVDDEDEFHDAHDELQDSEDNDLPIDEATFHSSTHKSMRAKAKRDDGDASSTLLA